MSEVFFAVKANQNITKTLAGLKKNTETLMVKFPAEKIQEVLKGRFHWAYYITENIYLTPFLCELVDLTFRQFLIRNDMNN